MAEPSGNDNYRGRLRLAEKIIHETRYDGFFSMVVDGVQRTGKTSYVSKGLAYANGKWELRPVPHCVEPDFESVKPWIIFKPKEFLDLVLEVDEKERCLIWDDAGYWLFSLDWYDPFVKAVSKWIQIAGTQFACIILTTPQKSLISSKVLTALVNHYTCRITKAGSDTDRRRMRIAKAYQTWDYPDGRRGGCPQKVER